MAQPAPTTRWRHFVLLAYLGLVACCSLELVPGWEILELGWSVTRFHILLAVVGLIVGFLMSEQYWLPGLIAGPVIGMGGLATVAWHLTVVSSTNSVFVFFLTLAGTIPGWALYTALRLVQAQVVAPAASDRTPAPQTLRTAR